MALRKYRILCFKSRFGRCVMVIRTIPGLREINSKWGTKMGTSGTSCVQSCSVVILLGTKSMARLWPYATWYVKIFRPSLLCNPSDMNRTRRAVDLREIVGFQGNFWYFMSLLASCFFLVATTGAPLSREPKLLIPFSEISICSTSNLWHGWPFRCIVMNH